jgi:ABC-type transport system involved in cytochrome bd biosynthesis fused ATPase/permease subunit
LTGDPRKLLELYAVHRRDEQLDYYKGRVRTYSRALTQLAVCSAIILVAASTAAALAGKDVAHAPLWAVLAAVFPALSTLLAAYGALFGFDQQTKLFTDAAKAVQRLRREAPDLGAVGDEQEALRLHVERVEEVFRREQAQWGQFAAEETPPTSGP